MPLFLGRLQGCCLPPLLPASTVRPQKEEAALFPSSVCQYESSHAYAQSSRPPQEHSSFSFCLSPQLPRRSDATSFPSSSPSLLSPPIPHLHQKTPIPKTHKITCQKAKFYTHQLTQRDVHNSAQKFDASQPASWDPHGEWFLFQLKAEK